MEGHMAIRAVERTAPDPGSGAGAVTVKQLERMKFAGHDWVHDNAANATANLICGFDKWYDNHYGIDGGALSLNQYMDNFDKRGWPYYHGWAGDGIGPENMYAVDPTGDAIQLDSMWDAGTAPPGMSGDALQSMCTQGNCMLRAAPAQCSSALQKLCPGLSLKGGECTECTYVPHAFGALKEAGCRNADLVTYCIGK
jgi:hypothetical protein